MLNEGFSIIKNSQKVFDYKISLKEIEPNKYVLLLGNGKEIKIENADEELLEKFIIVELNDQLVNYMESIINDSDFKIITHSENQIFNFRQTRCRHIRSKGPLRGEVCNKFLIGVFTKIHLGGQIFCPRCQTISYV